MYKHNFISRKTLMECTFLPEQWDTAACRARVAPNRRPISSFNASCWLMRQQLSHGDVCPITIHQICEYCRLSDEQSWQMTSRQTDRAPSPSKSNPNIDGTYTVNTGQYGKAEGTMISSPHWHTEFGGGLGHPILLWHLIQVTRGIAPPA